MKLIKKILYVFLFIIIYDFLHNILNINEVILPSFKNIILSFYNNFNVILVNLLYSLFETIIGLFLAILIGIVSVILINEYKSIKKVFLKFVYILQTIPIIAVAPLIIIWLGIGILPKIILVIIYCSFPIIINLNSSFENISLQHKDYILTLTNNKFKLYKFLYFPLSIESLISGIKMATTYAFICTITAEYLGTKRGIGLLLNRAYSSYQTNLVFVLIIIIVLITISFLKIVEKVENKIGE